MQLLNRLGYQPDLVENGEDVLKVIQTKQYDVILMDIQRPLIDGEETTRRIRETVPAASQPHIIPFTAHALSGDREQLLAAGMNAYISKPVNVVQLIEVLYRAREIGQK